MPTAEEVLRGLAQIANEAVGISIAWHIAIGIAVVAFLAGVRPPTRIAAAVLSAPLVSVSVLAFAFGNPFNGAVFALLSSTLAVLALRAPAGVVALGPRWSVWLGCFLLVFAWTYPHFLEARPALAYLYAAPLGAIPCPTLSLAVGAALVAGGFGSRAWRVTLAAAACFYGLFGVLRLGVVIDVVLLAGGLGLLAQDVVVRGRSRAGPAVISR